MGGHEHPEPLLKQHGTDDDPLLEAMAARKHTLCTVHLDSKTEYSADFVAGMRNLGLQVVVTDEDDSYT
jgi:hypothetical protein